MIMKREHGLLALHGLVEQVLQELLIMGTMSKLGVLLVSMQLLTGLALMLLQQHLMLELLDFHFPTKTLQLIDLQHYLEHNLLV